MGKGTSSVVPRSPTLTRFLAYDRTDEEYMAYLTTLSQEASLDPHSLLTTGCYAPKYLPSRKHFPDAMRSRVCTPWTENGARTYRVEG